jgi:aminoglycoside phosphotransferase (APT) family kinase protein
MTTMESSEVQRAVEAARATASELGLQVHDAVVVHNSNRIAVRLVPCDVLARVAPPAWEMAVAELEVEVARRLAECGSPVAELEPRVEPRVYAHGGFSVTLWTYYEPVPSPDLSSADYAEALVRLHTGLRQIDVRAPHFTDRVADAQRLVADREQTPGLLGADRELLSNTLSRLSASISGRGSGEQLLHGEPHPGNLLRTGKGPLFIDFETCCTGPVEFDIAHGLFSDGGRPLTAEEVCGHYPASDQDGIEQCRILIWAMITTWRWDRDDQLPNGRYWALEGLNQLREALGRSGLDVTGDHA